MAEFNPIAASSGLLVFGFVLWLAASVLTDRQGENRSDVVGLALLIVAGVFMAMGLLVLLVWLLFSVIGFLLVAFVVVWSWFRFERSRQRAFLCMLAATAKRGIPMAPAVRALALDQRGWYGARLDRLAELLEKGCPLPEALLEHRGLVGVLPLVRIKVGHQSGALVTALEQLATDRTNLDTQWARAAGRIAYVLLIVGLTTTICQFMALKIIPAYEKIFQEFEASLPLVTKMLVATMEFVGTFWWAVVPVISVVGAGLMLAMLLLSFGVAMPGFQWVLRRTDGAEVLDALALAAERGKPLHPVIATLAETYPRSSIRAKLLSVLRKSTVGGDWPESLAQEKLIRPVDQAVLLAAHEAGNLAWALRHTARGARQRAGFRMDFFSKIFFPVPILAIGAVVGFIVIGLFVPLIVLISSLT